jgi:hypothetical protein
MDAWRRPRTVARLAKTLLFVWLFAVVAGWANACLLQSRSQGPALALEHPVTPATKAAIGESAVDHHDNADEAAGKSACLHLCDDEQCTIPKYDTPAAADLAAAPMIASTLWSFSVVDTPLPRAQALAAALPPERPVAIRFLRLTI